jgi:glycerol-3-phosphate dehydrogenase (NAD(P)+)
MPQKRVLILGHGAMGRMFEQLLGPHYPLSIWDRNPDTGEETAPLESVAPGHDLALLAVPTSPHEELAERLAACLSSGALCLSIAKGLDAAGNSPAEILARHFHARDNVHWGVIYGPMIARDLSEGRSGFALAAARKMASANTMVSWFQPTALYLQADDDPIGAAWAAILKNVYVPLIGMADGLHLGDNMRGFLLCEALAELARILAFKGGRASTAYGLAGLGDLMTTATSPHSHHRGIGEALAKGDRSDIAADDGNLRSEGVNTARRVREHGLLDLNGFPLFRIAADCIDAPEAMSTELNRFLTDRFPGYETK